MDDLELTRALHGGLTVPQMQARITELERQLAETERILANTQQQRDEAYRQRVAALEQRAELCASIPTVQHTPELPQYDPVFVRTLWQAYNEVKQAQQWQPVENGSPYEYDPKSTGVEVEGDRLTVLKNAKALSVFLPDDIRLCRKVQP